MMEFIRIKGKVYERCEESLTTLFMFENGIARLVKEQRVVGRRK